MIQRGAFSMLLMQPQATEDNSTLCNVVMHSVGLQSHLSHEGLDELGDGIGIAFNTGIRLRGAGGHVNESGMTH